MSPSNPSTKLNSGKIILGKITHRASCLRVNPAQNYPGYNYPQGLMSPIWVNFLGNWGEITLKVDRFHEAFTQRHKRVCYSQKIYPRSPKILHGYIRHIRDIFQLWGGGHDILGTSFNFQCATPRGLIRLLTVGCNYSLLGHFGFSFKFSMCCPKGAHSFTHRWLQLLTFGAFWI